MYRCFLRRSCSLRFSWGASVSTRPGFRLRQPGRQYMPRAPRAPAIPSPPHLFACHDALVFGVLLLLLLVPAALLLVAQGENLLHHGVDLRHAGTPGGRRHTYTTVGRTRAPSATSRNRFLPPPHVARRTFFSLVLSTTARFVSYVGFLRALSSLGWRWSEKTNQRWARRQPALLPLRGLRRRQIGLGNRPWN